MKTIEEKAQRFDEALKATVKEIDEYCSLCMDINCTGCEYHDVHFRNIKKK